MAACGQIFKCWQWRSSGGPHGHNPQRRFLSSVGNSALSSPSSMSGSAILSSKLPSPAAGYGASTHHLPVLAFQRLTCFSSRAQHHGLKHGRKEGIESQVWNRFGFCESAAGSSRRPWFGFPSRAQHHGLKHGRKEGIESQVWNRFGLCESAAGSSRRPWFGTSAITQGFVSPVGTSSTWKEHAELLQEFYLENEFLFVDETWGALEKGEQCEGGISPSVKENLSLMVAAGRVQRGSRVLIWGGSVAFMHELLVTTSPSAVVVTHFSMSVLATVKEMDDDVICWLGDIADLPDSYGPFDTVFINSVLATADSPADLLRGVANLCNHGGKIVIGSTQGKKELALCRERNPTLILQSLPDAADLQKMVNPLPLNVVYFQDDPSFYLATLEVEQPLIAMHSQNGSGQQQFPPLHARGHIVQGFGRGSKQMGIPTANIDPVELPREILALPKGVYFGWAKQHGADELDGGVYKMVMNIGNRPTFDDGVEVTVEAHILHDFSGDYYGKELSIVVLGFIRAEMRFSSLGELVQRINTDIATADKLLDKDEMLQYANDDFFVQ